MSRLEGHRKRQSIAGVGEKRVLTSIATWPDDRPLTWDALLDALGRGAPPLDAQAASSRKSKVTVNGRVGVMTVLRVGDPTGGQSAGAWRVKVNGAV